MTGNDAGAETLSWRARLREVVRGTLVLAALASTGLGALLFYCMHMPGVSVAGPLPPLDANQEVLRERLRAHVQVLAEEIGERHHHQRRKLDAAADYVTAQWETMGLVPSQMVYGEGFRNVVVDFYGRERRDEVIVVGAHYDTVTMTPGADDNASGVAGLLELGRRLQGAQLRRSVRLVAFANEEWPFFGRDEMGSRVAARQSRDRNENVVGMISLEMIGYYSADPRSQWYPRIIRRFYPDRGNFIAFVSDFTSRDLLVDAIGSFRRHARYPSEGMAAPQWLVRDVRRSDQSSYWASGYPGLMITDTANFRNYGYHNVGDTARTLDYEAMTRVVDGIAAMVAELAGANLIN